MPSFENKCVTQTKISKNITLILKYLKIKQVYCKLKVLN